MKRRMGFAIAFVFALVASSLMVGPLMAQTKTDFSDSMLTFDAPDSLEPSVQYQFEFTVYNNATAESDWIYKIGLTLPSKDYDVDIDAVAPPNPLHPLANDYWDVGFNPSNATITWEIYGVTTSGPVGDIREGEQLSFSFVATADAKATDGFFWSLFGDQGNVAQGTAVIGSAADDDDDADDDTPEPNDDDGDDDDEDEPEPMPGSDPDNDDETDGGCCSS